MRNLIVTNFVHCICKYSNNFWILLGWLPTKLIHYKMQTMHWEVKAQLLGVSVTVQKKEGHQTADAKHSICVNSMSGV